MSNSCKYQCVLVSEVSPPSCDNRLILENVGTRVKLKLTYIITVCTVGVAYKRVYIENQPVVITRWAYELHDVMLM